MLLTELIADLRDESALWDALTADDDDEADAVRSVFAWSYRALPEPAARMFRLLGLHPGPEFGIPVAASLGGIDEGQARHLLDVLVGAHVLEQRSPGRYQFHDLLRAYAIDQVTQQETPETRRIGLVRALHWYLWTAHNAVLAIAPLNRHIELDPAVDGAVPLMFDDSRGASRWYEEERANLVAATHAAAAAGLHRLAWQLPVVLRNIYARQNPFEEWIDTARVGLESRGRSPTGPARPNCWKVWAWRTCSRDGLSRPKGSTARLWTFARKSVIVWVGACRSLLLAYWHGVSVVPQMRRTYFSEAIALFRELADRRLEMVSLSNLGMTYIDLDRFTEAFDVLSHSVSICREIGDRHYEGNALFFLATAQRELGHAADALISIDAALAIARDDGYPTLEGFWLLEHGRLQRVMGHPEDALTSYQRSAAIQRQIGDRSREAMAFDGTGESYRELGRFDEAVKFHRLAASTHRELGDRWQLAVSLDNLAIALNEAGDPEQARSCWAEAVTLLGDFADPRAVRMRDRTNRMLGHD